jgi:hypothetical protein
MKRLQNIYYGMKHRCYNRNNAEFHRYGGRGITVCDEWKDNFQSFYDWAMANGYKDNLSIDRIDNDKGYSPNNCKWATRLEQQSNLSNTIWVEIDGKSKSLRQWSRETGIFFNTLYKRYKKGIRGKGLIKEVQINKSHHKIKDNA